MQPLDLDFQRKPATWPLPGIVLLIAGITLTSTVMQLHVEVSDELIHAEGRLARIKRDVERQRLFDTRTESRAASNAVTFGKTRSLAQWEVLFSGLEAAADDTVTLLSLEPGIAEVSLRGEAKDFSAMTDYVKRLSALAFLVDVRLTEHEIAREHPRRPLRFSVRATWKVAP